MGKFAVFLLFMSFSVNASAPFGLSWGDNLNQYGEVVGPQTELRVKTEVLPKPLSIASYYILRGNQELGLLQVSMKSQFYSIYDDSFKEDFNFVKNSLIEIGYQTSEFVPSEVSSYKCVLQGSCSGKRWYAELDDGTHVALEQLVKNRKDGFIQLVFKSPQQVKIEAQLEAELTSKVQDNRVSDKSAFD